MNIRFTPTGWDDYLDWKTEDKKTLSRINRLILSICREGPLKGIGKPEPLRFIQAYSRRIDEKNRLVYQITPTDLLILSCKGHYED